MNRSKGLGLKRSLIEVLLYLTESLVGLPLILEAYGGSKSLVNSSSQ
jgi:biotin transporter BioY